MSFLRALFKSSHFLGLCPTFSRDHGTFTIENGQYSEGGYTIGTRVSMHCDPFYEELYGITVAYCRDGGWSSMPGCDRKLKIQNLIPSSSCAWREIAIMVA